MLNEKCYVEDLLTYLGKKWTLQILRYLYGYKKLRFNELNKEYRRNHSKITFSTLKRAC